MLNIPALRALKSAFENVRIIAVVDPYVKDLAQCIPLIDEVIEWSRGKHSLAQKIKFINLLKARRIDAAVMLNPSKEFNIFTYLSGIPVRVGYARKWDFLLTHKIEDMKHLGVKHEVEYNLELVGLLGAGTDDKRLFLSVDNGIIKNLVEDYGIKESDTLVALHPWASDPIKEWPLANFMALVRRLLLEKNIKVVIVGGKDELGRAQDFSKDSAAQNLINLTGKTTLKQLAAFLKRCKLLISGDSGPMHLASAVGSKVLAIFRNDIPGKASKRWGPWGEGHIIIQKSSLSDISVDEVCDKAKEALK